LSVLLCVWAAHGKGFLKKVTLNKHMEQNKQPRYRAKAPTRGGARAGAGRPKGSTNKITMEGILANLDVHLGVSYAEQIAINYASALNRSDWSGVRDYDKVLLGKVVADKTEVTRVDSTEAIEQRQAVFTEALMALAAIPQPGARSQQDK